MGEISKKSYLRQLIVQNWQVIIILLITILAYLPVFRAGFVNLDDNGYVYENQDIVTGGLSAVTHFFSEFYVGHYLPLTMLDLKIDYLLFGQSAQGYHIMNLLLHLLNSCLIFMLIFRLFNSRYSVIIVTAFFALHPMHVESVAWISERKDLLYVCFLLIAWIIYHRFITEGYKRKLLYVSLLFFLLSLLSKSAAVIFPLLLILTDLLSKRKLNRGIVMEKLPFLALSVVFGMLTLYSQDVGGKGSEAFAVFSGYEKLLLGLYSMGFYVLKLFYPFSLSAFHPFPDLSNGNLPADFQICIIISLIFLAVLTWMIIRAFKNKMLDKYLFGMLFFLICISLYLYLPVGRVIVADRFSYLSYTGLFIMFAVFISRQLESEINHAIKKYIILSTVLIVLLFSYISFQRTKIWLNGISLWENVLASYPSNPVANKSLADAFAGYRNYSRALDYYVKAITYNPSYAEAYYNMANMNLKNNHMHQAIHDYSKALELSPHLTDAYINRGNAKAQLNDLAGAISDYTLAIKFDPKKTEAYVNRGSSWYLLKKNDNACSDWRMAADLGSSQAKEMLLNYCR